MPAQNVIIMKNNVDHEFIDQSTGVGRSWWLRIQIQRGATIWFLRGSSGRNTWALGAEAFYETSVQWICRIPWDKLDAYKWNAGALDFWRYASVHYRDVRATLMRHQLRANNITIHNTSHCLHDNAPWPVSPTSMAIGTRISFYCASCTADCSA